MAGKKQDQHPDRLNTLSFVYRPSPDTNDHQIVVVIDGHERIDDDFLGLDPPGFFVQPALTTQGRLLIGRCTCGCIGCADVDVEVQRADDVVTWIEAAGRRLRFDAEAYDRVIAAARADTSWEDVNRTAERLVDCVLKGMTLNEEFTFQWSSARMNNGQIVLSFDGPKQKLIKIRWDGVSPDSAVAGAQQFRATAR
jgi:hypothetical protein